ncbi:hypothetical protein M7I_3448 [Glarea lozoyensis 74030]|uniref:Steroid 5-alpha reductase C-terminal domain-containing protein n=1 Tax=Glarea lozoyensis (strain ATCC 74030 / MF5533) TaxID=1104152 RepID=H0ELI4_GLAL7|nr:hypothetical protein M7I_3448 [Glarea lozoyensis 74030]
MKEQITAEFLKRLATFDQFPQPIPEDAPSFSLRARAAASLAGKAKPAFPSLIDAFTGKGGQNGLNWRQVVISTAVAIWATRLGSYLFQRVIADGHDSRFDEIKKSPPKFFGAFMIQALNSIPRTALAALPLLGITDIVGLALFAGGLSFEVTADRQKNAWVQAKKNKEHDEDFLTHGLWSKSRHPNYFTIINESVESVWATTNLHGNHIQTVISEPYEQLWTTTHPDCHHIQTIINESLWPTTYPHGNHIQTAPNHGSSTRCEGTTEASEKAKKREKRNQILWTVLPIVLVIPVAWFLWAVAIPLLVLFWVWVERRWVALKAKMRGGSQETRQDVEAARGTSRA